MNKITLLIVILAILFIVSFGDIFISLSQLNRHFSTFEEKNDDLQLIQNLDRQINHVWVRTLVLLHYHNYPVMDEQKNNDLFKPIKVAENQQIYNSILKELGDNINERTEKGIETGRAMELLPLIKEESLKHDQIVSSLIQVVLSKETDNDLVNNLVLKGIESGGKIIDLLNEVKNDTDKIVEQAERDFSKEIDTFIQLAIVIFGVLFIIFIFIYFLTKKYIVKPINNLKEAVDEYKKGNLDVQVEVKSKDELGQLSDAFIKMAKSLKNQEKEKAEFIVSASHQINTPISGVRFELQSLKKKLISEQSDKKEVLILLDEIINNNLRGVEIINDLFKLLELGTNYRASNLEPNKIKDIVSVIINSYSEDIKNKEITEYRNFLGV